MLEPRRTTRVLNGRGGSPLDELVRQLWLPAVRTGHARVVVNPRRDPRWTTVERYLAVPSARPRLLVAADRPAVTAAAFVTYKRLRSRRTRWARTGYGALARTGLLGGASALEVQVLSSAARDGTAPDLPLRSIGRELGLPRLRPAIGVLGGNRKVTLQLFDADGEPVGYAKTSWNRTTADLVRAETEALRAVAWRTGRIRVPAAIGAGEWAGRPFVVTAPLPRSVRALSDPAALPGPDTLADLMPVHRTGEVIGTGHALAVRRRLDALPHEAGTEALRGAVERAWAALVRRQAVAGIATRWHGDFVPWNLAREGADQLWCWDWESSESDAVAGLDAVHWNVSIRRDRSAGPMAHLPGALAAAQDHLRAAGTPMASWPDVAALYAVALTERVWTYAAGSDGWSDGSITPGQLVELLDGAVANL
ncbi:hypothetical protein [Georgenia sp. AZ-5]|uniref:hypothetical protein n=1 Tax=Georgenia sp. AZ-5 TaxID=3367526 RepID=UPI003753FE31